MCHGISTAVRGVLLGATGVHTGAVACRGRRERSEVRIYRKNKKRSDMKKTIADATRTAFRNKVGSPTTSKHRDPDA